MGSDEEYYEEEEVTSNTSKKGDGNFLKARQEAKKGELDEQLREYINEWRKQRAKEEEELERLKEKQAKRKEIRAEQEKKLAQQKKEEEERLRKEEADKKAKEAEEKRKRLEEAEKKRQDYDLKELKERQKQQLRQKAMKKGLDPEALTGKYPPKIRMYSKYERRTDTRTYEDRRKLYEGGWEVLYCEILEKDWKEKLEEFGKHARAKLPKWFGERPGKKAGEPESPEDEDDAGAA